MNGEFMLLFNSLFQFIPVSQGCRLIYSIPRNPSLCSCFLLSNLFIKSADSSAHPSGTSCFLILIYLDIIC